MIKKILIVEDEDDVFELLNTIFNDPVDYEVFWAKDGHEALKIAQVEKPAMILLDVLLPGLSGYEVCRLIKSNPALSSVRVLMLSGMTQYQDYQKAQEAGADDFIAKPFSSNTLLKKVEELLTDNRKG
jgi:DNA-binding response OmpR family regulator